MFARVRKCRYCEEEGHNRRTCRDLKNDKEYYRALCVDMRREVLEWLQKNGVGVGALVAYARYGDTPEHVGLVKGAQLSWITPHRADHRLTVEDPSVLHPFLSECQVISVANAKYLGDPRFIAALKVLSPVAFNVAKFDLPDGWADGLDKATLEARDDHFKESGRWRVRRYTLKMPTSDC
jgi:hypothetical protein